MSQTLVEILKVKTLSLTPTNSSIVQALLISEDGKDHFVLHKQSRTGNMIENYKIEFPSRNGLMDAMQSPPDDAWVQTNELCGYMIGPVALVSAYLNYIKRENEPHI